MLVNNFETLKKHTKLREKNGNRNKNKDTINPSKWLFVCHQSLLFVLFRSESDRNEIRSDCCETNLQKKNILLVEDDDVDDDDDDDDDLF